MPRRPGEHSTRQKVKLDTIRAASLAAAGATHERIAQELDVTDRTVRAYLSSADGRRETARIEREVRERSSRMISSVYLQAVRTLSQAMSEAPRWADKIAAARTVVAMEANAKPMEIDVDDDNSDLTRRIEEATRRLANTQIIDVEVTDPGDDPPALTVAR